MPLLLGLDVGTSATKAILLDERGRIRAMGSAGHPSSHPHPGWSEQTPQDWWGSAVAAARLAVGATGVDAEEVAAIGLSGQMHGSVLLDTATLDSRGESSGVLRPAILWNDQRTARECAWIEQRAGGREALVRMVGNAALPGFTLPKLLWVREHEPAIWARVAAVLLPKDYVRFRLTGAIATDVGDAAGTLLFDIDRRQWSQEAADLFGVDASVLPPVLEAGSVAGRLTGWAAAALGVKRGIPVIAGSGDNQCGAIGAGVVEPGLVLATLGTSGVMYAHAVRPERDIGRGGQPAGRVHTMCAADGGGGGPGHWSITGCTLSAGGSLAWARDEVFGRADLQTLLQEAAAAPAGSEGLVFLPYLTGERCPHPDPEASGAWIGLTSRHSRGHMVRAVLEGVSLTMAEILSIMGGIGISARTCRLGGGGVRSPLWRDILTAALDVPTQTMETEEGPGVGAALLAGVGLGIWPDAATACRQTVRVLEEHQPREDLAGVYRDLAPVFAQCYLDLRGTMARLAQRRGSG